MTKIVISDPVTGDCRERWTGQVREAHLLEYDPQFLVPVHDPARRHAAVGQNPQHLSQTVQTVESRRRNVDPRRQGPLSDLTIRLSENSTTQYFGEASANVALTKDMLRRRVYVVDSR